MLSVIEQHRLAFPGGLEILVRFVAVVKEVETRLVEEQRRAEYDPNSGMQAAFFHEPKITIS